MTGPNRTWLIHRWYVDWECLWDVLRLCQCVSGGSSSTEVESLLRLQGAVLLISVRVWFLDDLGNRGKVPQVLDTSHKRLHLRLSFHNSEIGAEVREGDKNLD